MLRRTAPALLALALLTACGGGSTTQADAAAPSPTASPSPSPTGPVAFPRREFIARAENVCTDAVTELQAIAPAPDPQGLVATYTAVLSAFRTAQAALVEVSAAQPDLPELERILLTPLAAQAKAFEDYLPKLGPAVTGLTAERSRELDALLALDDDAVSPQQLARLLELSAGLDAFLALPDPVTVSPDLAALKAYGFVSCVALGEQEQYGPEQ